MVCSRNREVRLESLHLSAFCVPDNPCTIQCFAAFIWDMFGGGVGEQRHLGSVTLIIKHVYDDDTLVANMDIMELICQM